MATLTRTRIPTRTQTPTISVQEIQAQTLTAWAIPATPTLSPTPTFDINSIRTSTLAPAAVCPQIEPEQVPTLSYNGEYRLGVPDTLYLDYLNTFGVEALLQADRSTIDLNDRSYSRVLLHQDLTNDGVRELIISHGPLYIFGCKDGKYQTLLATEKSAHDTVQRIIATNDLNRNGVPEILVHLDTGTQADTYYRYFEWVNGEFASLFSYIDDFSGQEDDNVWVLANGKFSFRDTTGDGMKEIVLYDGITLTADYFGSTPWRRMTKTFHWNGEKFVLTKKVFDPPVYRFQAVEDADYAVLAQEYDRALALYQQAIFDDKLEWWSEGRLWYDLMKISAAQEKKPFNDPLPPEDPNEYLSLSAYSRFRIMILHLLRGYESDAQVVYQTLLEKHPEGTPGSVFAQMAKAFWENYQKTRSLGQACGVAREIAFYSGEDVTRYLMDDYVYGGYPKADYTIGQMCPFR